MQERNVTAAGKKYELSRPFFVLATQNPIEQEGTYPLPEAQLDRFMFSLFLDYPSIDEELEIVRTTTTGTPQKVEKVLSAEEIMFFQDLVRKIPVNDNVLRYAVSLASKSRPRTENSGPEVNAYLSWGAGPRASQYLVLGAKCHAALSGKYSPDIEDVNAVAHAVLRHRIVRNYKAEAEGITVESIISGLLK